MSDSELYPRLRSAVRIDPREPVHSVALGDTDLQFKGVPNALLKDVVARFTGRHSLESICAVYPANVAPVVKLIASKMQERRMLLLARRSREIWEVEGPQGAQSTWAYMSDRVPDPTEAFRRWRGEPILVRGRGRGFRQAVAGLANAGAGHLRIAAESAADRDWLAPQLALHSVRDEGFAYAWVDPAGEADPVRLLIQVLDDALPTSPTDAQARALPPHVPRIVAGTAGGWGIVLRVRPGAAAEPPLLPPPPAGADSGASDYALAVLGSMAAFQALNAVMMDPQAGQAALIPLSDRVLIRPDGGLYVSDTPDSPAPAPAEEPGGPGGSVEDGVRSPHQRERERWVELTAPFFAATSPLLSWEDEMPLPTFPLAHRAIRLLPGHARERLVTRWAASPSEVTALTLKKGVGALADALTGQRGHVVGLTMEDWSRTAYLAWAEAGAPGALLRPSDRRLSYEDSEDVRFRTLVRLLNLYLGSPPDVEISLDGRSGAPRADVKAGGFHRFALGSSPLDAAVEALGRTLSGLQLGEAPAPAPPNLPAAPLPCGLGLGQKAAFDAERLGLRPRLLDSLGGVAIAGFLVGRYAEAGGDG